MTRLLPTAILLATLLAPERACRAQTATVTYDLVGVNLVQNITYPNATTPYPMSGAFVWTYTVGDFENGTGQFTSLSVPWWSSSQPALIETIELDQIELTMQGNYHNLGFDMTIRLQQDLSPFLPSAIDHANSTFDIQVGVSHQGHIVSGSIVPRCPVPTHYGAGTAGTGGVVPVITHSGGDPHIGNLSFAIDGAQLLGGAFCGTLMSFQQDAQSLFGATILVDPSQVIVAPGMATGTFGLAGAGQTHLPVPLPNAPAAIGTALHFQIMALDAGSIGGLAAASDGLTVTLCN